MKLVFTPVSLGLSLLAGIVGQKIFEKVWGVVDDEEASSPEHREFPWPKLIVALLVEGAIFRLVKGLTDHGARRAFAGATGTWPGEEAPERD
ncbi:MAG TPA: DUF4235 domain-containing protein [Solirubrobacterales bacterium]|nr:DUF4235 domain-containing protein [Solirubrobacterales bacterium]